MSRSVGVVAALLVSAQIALIYAQAPGATSDGSSRTVWDGVYTEAQAQRGSGFYAEHCASCHGASLEGAEHRALKGDRFWATWQDTTLDRLLTHVSTNMPRVRIALGTWGLELGAPETTRLATSSTP